MSGSPRWWFELHAPVFDRFDAPLGRYYDDTRDMAVELLNLPEDRDCRVLDLGGGTGSVTMRVLDRCPRALVTLLDASAGMLEQARPKLQGYDDRVRVRLANVETEPLEETWDGVLSCDALHHVPLARRWELFGEICRSLPPGGAFVYQDILCRTPPPPVDAAFARIDARYRSQVYAEQGWTPEAAQEVLEERRQARNAGSVYGAQEHATTLEEVTRQLRAAGFTQVYVAWQYFDRFLLAAYR